MIFINLGDIELPEGWEEGAKEALWKVRCTCPTSRNEAVNAHSKVWEDCKKALKKLSNKCWYCESKDLRSDKEVEHFRPKNEVTERKGEHSGYWWLAFDYKNYRYSCTFCNQARKNEELGETLGKGSSFPVFNEDERAMVDGDDHLREDNCLLDPIVQADPGFLWFIDSGESVPRYSEEDHPRLYERARSSIENYHLNHPDIREARLELANEIKKLVRDGDVYFHKMATGDKTVEHAFGRVAEMLSEKMHRKAQFSAFASAIIMGFRSKPWIESLFVTH